MKTRDYFISEKGFRETMQNTVEPYLRGIAEDGFFEANDGKKIHFVYYKAESAAGNVVIAHGFTESAEKFLEMCWYFNKMNLNVFIVDHRGHGLSHRHNDDPGCFVSVIHFAYIFPCSTNSSSKPFKTALPRVCLVSIMSS